MAEWTDRQRYVFRRTIQELGDYRGMGTELVTLYIPPTRQISDAAGMLRDELGQASNIKSKQTATAVQSALTSMLARLKNYRLTPPNGLALFVGNVSTGSNKTKQVAHVIEPPEAIQTYQYRCDSTFNVEPLEHMGQTEDVYGLLIIDRKECSIGLLRGKSIVAVSNKGSLVPNKHGRGGQSQRRFERLTEEIANQWFTESGNRASEIFMNEPHLKAVLIGGPGPTKEFFAENGYLHHEIQKKVHKAYFDTGYTDDDQGLKELVEAASTAIEGIAMMDDKRLMQQFLRETSKPDGGLGEYGEEPVRTALEYGAVNDLLLSAIVPGLLMAVAFLAYIVIRCRLQPSLAPAYEVERTSAGHKLKLLVLDVAPMMSIVVGVILLILHGWATPSESAAFGCLGVIILAALYRRLTWDGFVKSVSGALRVTVMALLIIFGSATFSALLAFSGASSGLIRFATQFDLPPVAMLLIMFAILLVLGMFMDQLSMMLLTVPIFFPLAQSLGFDLIWFGVIILLALEISFTTPPFGLLLFVMKGVATPGTTMRDIYVAAIPYMGCAILLVGLLIVFPEIALWLPSLGD